jgi:hypothetical protein
MMGIESVFLRALFQATDNWILRDGPPPNDDAILAIAPELSCLIAASEPEEEKDGMNWISVSERLPDRNEIVLATDQDGVTVGSYSPMLDDWWTLHGDRMAPGAVVTNWMPLPKPPTE